MSRALQEARGRGRTRPSDLPASPSRWQLFTPGPATPSSLPPELFQPGPGSDGGFIRLGVDFTTDPPDMEALSERAGRGGGGRGFDCRGGRRAPHWGRCWGPACRWRSGRSGRSGLGEVRGGSGWARAAACGEWSVPAAGCCVPAVADIAAAPAPLICLVRSREPPARQGDLQAEGVSAGLGGHTGYSQWHWVAASTAHGQASSPPANSASKLTWPPLVRTPLVQPPPIIQARVAAAGAAAARGRRAGGRRRRGAGAEAQVSGEQARRGAPQGAQAVVKGRSSEAPGTGGLSDAAAPSRHRVVACSWYERSRGATASRNPRDSKTLAQCGHRPRRPPWTGAGALTPLFPGRTEQQRRTPPGSQALARAPNRRRRARPACIYRAPALTNHQS